MAMAGITRDDIIQVGYGYGLFTGGLGAHYGAENLGAMVIPMSTGNTKKLIDMMIDCEVTAIACTPSYLLHVAEALEEQGLIDRIKLKYAICGAEPWTDAMRDQMEKRLGIKAYDIYGLTEISGPGVAFECSAQNGMHINEDHFIAEIINPQTGEVLPYGEKGELVFTSITKEAFPLLRYRTKDICVLNPEPCACGRTHVRMAKPMGRSDDMLIIRGVNVFPSQIEAVILSLPEFEPHFMLTVDRVNNTDTSELRVEVKEEYFTDEMGQMVGLQKKLEAELRSVIGLGFKVKLAEPKSIERSEGKARRVIDKRQFK
jgi:phenylacetate-CoA ligase